MDWKQYSRLIQEKESIKATGQYPELIAFVEQFQEAIRAQYGREPTAEEIAKEK